jgi:23S rRNA (guanosine2251-2'-O)-methyltransferase
MKTEILYGSHPVLEALRAGRRQIIELYVVLGRPAPLQTDIVRLAQQRRIPIRKVTPAQLESYTGTDVHQKIGAKVTAVAADDLNRLLTRPSDPGTDPFYLLLDGVVDPRNLGALVRTAVCIGATAVITPKDRSAPFSAAAAKASAGAVEHARLCRVTNMRATVTALKKRGVWIVGLDRDGDASIYESDFTMPLGLVVGGEQKGLRPLVKKHCDFLVHIPQKGPVDSLNAAVAGAVAMYEIFRQKMRPA